MGTGKRKFNSSNRQRMMQGKMLAANISYRIVNVVIVFIINLLLSRMAGVAGYGLLSLLIANAGIFNLLSAFGADAGISFHTASGRLAIGKLLSFILVIICFQLVVLIFAEMICWSVSGHLLLFKTYDLQYWWIGPLFLTSISIVEKYSALLNGKQKFTLVNRVIAVSNLLTLFVFAALYLIENPGSFHFLYFCLCHSEFCTGYHLNYNFPRLFKRIINDQPAAAAGHIGLLFLFAVHLRDQYHPVPGLSRRLLVARSLQGQ
jgi:hypothetical protein